MRSYFPLDAEYVIRVKLGQGGGGGDRRLEIRQPVRAGLRTIGVTFLRESAKAEVALLGSAPSHGRRVRPAAEGLRRWPNWTCVWTA